MNVPALGPSPIRSFSIFGLNGDRDVTLSFDQKAKIIVGENGTGKTTILATLYYLLSANFWRLSFTEFERLEVRFHSGDLLTLDSGELATEQRLVVTDKWPGFVRRVVEHFSVEQLQTLVESYRLRPEGDMIRRSGPARDLMAHSPFSSMDVTRALRAITASGLDVGVSDETSSRVRASLKDNFIYPLLYLPTYRRVEEELTNLGMAQPSEELANTVQLINFGMSDVRKRLASIAKDIIDTTAHWYQIMSGRMIDELMLGIAADSVQYDTLKRTDELDLLLRRLSTNVSEVRRHQIIELVQSERIQQDRYKPLAYLLSKLIEIYDKQRQIENSLVQFVDITNKYLVNKELKYDPNEVAVTIINERNKRDVALERLSSGEKQVLSLFSLLYLSGDKQYAILFDEPELSLSIDWQRLLLPDMVRSGRCAFLLAATHSPFVYDNELEALAQPSTIQYRD